MDTNMDVEMVASMEADNEDCLQVNGQFLSYHALVVQFFLSPDAFERLEKIYNEKENGIFDTIVFFVKIHQRNKIVRNLHNSFHCISDEYKSGVTSHKKRYYDFKSKSGRGDLVYKGKVNPPVLVEHGDRSISLPLPCLVACWWFIQNNFDTFFWAEFEEVKRAHDLHVTNNKRIYSTTHKTGKSKIRQAVIKRVIDERETNESEQEKPKGKKRPFLTRRERQLVSDLVVAERASMKEEQQKRSKKTHPPKHRNKETTAVIIAKAGTLCEDEDMNIKK